MRIAFNPSTVAALTTPPNNKDITFDLKGRNIFARGVKFYGTDTNTWRPVVDNLTSNSTTSSLSANQGRVLKALIDGKSDSGHNHDGRYVRYYAVTTLDCNNLAAGLTAARVSATNAAHTNNSVYLYISDIGTPFQIQIPDSNVPYIYKRYYSSGKWSGWFKLNAGYADSAGSVAWANITGKPSSYTPSAHTHAWNSLTHSSTTENQAILTNGKANGWKLYTLNISGWNNAANNAHSHANKSVLDGITSGLVNNWNTAYTFVHTITGTDTDKVINKWDEIVNFLAGITEDNKLNTLLNSKLSVYELADKTNVGTIKNNGIYYSTTEASTGTLTNSPFTNAFALINMTNLNNNEDQLRRCRLAFSRVGDIKVSDDHLDDGTAETWYNVLTSKNSGIDGSTIKLNGTSITVYSSGTADGRYVKKSGDTMTGALNFANATWNKVGDDVAIGDHNVAGCLGIKGLNGGPGLAFYNSSNTLLSKLVGTANQLQRVSEGKTYTIIDTASPYITHGVYVFGRSEIGNSPNYDDPQKNGLFEIRSSSEVTGETGTKPFNGWGAFLNLKTPDNIAMLQIVGSTESLYYRANQAGNVTMAGVSWKKVLDTGNSYVRDGKGVINGSTITLVDKATNATNSTNARKLVNWYSSRPTSLNAQFGDGSLRIFYATLSTTEGKPAEDSHILHLAWDNTGGWDAQLAVHTRSGKVSTRAQNGGTWQPWKTLAFTTDIPTSLKNPHALTISLNGTSQGPYDGSATKNINITPGSIGAATSVHTHDYLVVNTADDKSFNSAYHNFQVLYAGGSNEITGKPANVDAFGLFRFRTAFGWSGQMLLANGGSLYIRSSEDAKMTNTLAWKTILDSSNYSGILDSRYYTESEVNSLLSKKLDRVNLTTGTWNPRGYSLAADYHYNGGDLSISENGGKMYVSIDGQFYQNEGQYRVLDTSDIGSIRGGLTLYQYLSSTDTNWFPLIWGGSDHKNTNNSTGSLYKSYDKLSWQTSSQTLYATNIQTENIKHLSIGGGIYWNPDVESATDGSDAASITLVKSGVAGGTTLVLSQMNDANDTIQFKTSTAAKLYHNSYPILTTQNTYVSNNKGYINGTEITQVNNSDTVDGEHASAFTKIIGRHFISTTGTAPYKYIHLFRIANSYTYSTIDCEIDFRTRYHSAKLEIRISANNPQYGASGSSISIIKKVINGRSCNFWVLPTVQSSGYNYYDIYYESGGWNSGTYDIILRGTNGNLVFEHKGTKLDALPSNTSVVNNQWVSWNDIAGKPSSFNPSSHNHDNKYLKWLGNAGQSNMNAIGRISHSSGMTSLGDPGNTIDNPMEGSSKSTSWHLYWQTNYTDDPSGSNAWVAQIVNKAGTDRWWVRSRNGGTITNGTGWTSNWRFLVTAPTSGLGNGNQPVYINSAGEVVVANIYPTSLKSPHSLTLKANGTTLAIYDGSSAKEANFTYANVGAASASHTHTYIVAEDLRNKYPAQILDPRRMKLSFLAASTLGIKNNGTYYDVITVRSYGDATAGSDNALLFSKNTNSLYHTRFAFGSTDSWGSPLLIIDSGNIGSQSVNYANSANHANSAGNANTLGGTSLGGLFTAFGNNAHNITATIGGVTKSFLVNYAADADKLDGKHASDFATAGHNHDSRYVKIWGNVEANFNFPDGEGHSGVYMCHTTKTQSNKPETYGLLTDFSTVNGHLQFFGASSNKIYTRTYWQTDQDNFKYTDWHTLLHTGNSSVSGHTITINGTSTTWSNSWRPIGTGASDAAAGNHTHKVKINGSEKTIAATGVTDLGTYLTSQSLRGYVHAYNNTGTGNAVTSISIEGGTITANKGTTFLTSHQSLANYYTKGQVDAKLGKYLPLAGGTMDAGAQIQRTATGGMWYQGRSIALLRETSANGYHALWSLKTTDGSWDFGEYNSSGWNNIPVLSYVLDSNFDKGSNITTYQIKFPLASGTIALTSNILNPTNYYWANNKITSTSKIDAEVRVKNLGAGCSTTIENTIMATNWVRAMGNTGIYFQDHGGGLYMSDNTWIRTWAGKALQVDNTIRSTDFHTTYYANNVWTITSAAKLENSTTLVYGTNTSSQSINTYLRGTNVTLQVKKGTSTNYNALQLTSDRIYCNNYCDMKYGAAVSGGNLTVQNNSYLAQIIGSKVGIGTKNPQYTLDVGDKMRAGGYIHSGHNSNDAMLLAGGGWKKLSTLVEYPSDESYIYRKTTTEYDLRFVKLVNFNNLIYVDGWISADANGKSFTLGAKFKPYLYRDDHSIPTIVQMGWDDVVTIDGDGNVGFHIEGGRKKRIGFFYTGRA